MKEGRLSMERNQMKQPINSDVLEEAVLREIGASGPIRTFPANAIIINEGDRTNSLYLILAGRVKVYADSSSGRSVVFGIHGKGEYVGELALDGDVRAASVITLEPTICSVVDGLQLRKFVVDHPDFAMHLVHKLIRKVRLASEKVKSLALMDAYGRVARLLLELCENEGRGDFVIKEKLTQQDISERVGCSREMVSRIMTELTRGGYIMKEKGRIVVNRKLPPRW
jgi:CRP/FNR family cyclic AMP-dependent transcriptional regulator